MSILITSLSSFLTGPILWGHILNSPIFINIASMILPLAVAAQEELSTEEFLQELSQAHRDYLATSFFLFIRGVANIAAGWRLNLKADKPGWFAIIPFASHAMRWFIVGGRYWWIFLVLFISVFPLITVLPLLALLVLFVALLFFRFGEAKAYDAGAPMTILNILLPSISRLIMAFHPNYTYQGPVVQGYISRLFHLDEGPDFSTAVTSSGQSNVTNPSGEFSYPSFGTQQWNQDELTKAHAATNQTSYSGMNQSQTFTNSLQGYGGAGQGFNSPSQSYTGAGQGFNSPSQSYTGTGQGFNSPSQGYAGAGQRYAHSSQGFSNPSQAFSNPGQTFAGSVPSSPGVGGNTSWSQGNIFSSSTNMFPGSTSSSGSSQNPFFPNTTNPYPNMGGNFSSSAGVNPGGTMWPTPGSSMGTMPGTGTIPGMGTMPNMGTRSNMGTMPGMGTRSNMGDMPGTGANLGAGSSLETGSDSFFQS